MISGIKLGNMEINIIRKDINNNTMMTVIKKIASNMLSNKFFNKYSFPFKKILLLPVIVVLYFAGSKIEYFCRHAKKLKLPEVPCNEDYANANPVRLLFEFFIILPYKQKLL